MTPSIQITYLAVSKSGLAVASFDTPGSAGEFIKRQRAKQVRLTLVEQTVIRKPFVKREYDECKAQLEPGEGNVRRLVAGRK